MKRAKLSRPKSTDRGGGKLKYVRRSPAEKKTGRPNRLTLNFIYQTGSNQQPFQFNTHEVAATSWMRIPVLMRSQRPHEL